MSAIDITVVVAVAALFVLAVTFIIRRKLKNKGHCCDECDCCSHKCAKKNCAKKSADSDAKN